ncbi:hypothetical protein ACFW2X_26205 [Streptomyces antibioticus]|uniref:hypothetical protein n=1 Tax=Streptomyces antibioticus TaxID=1890 RepID=UPI0036A262A7
MTRWGGALGRRRGGRPKTSVGREGVGDTPRDESAGEAVLVEDYESLLLLRSASDDSLSAAEVAELARGQRSDDGTVTLIAGTESVAADAFWPLLSELLDLLRDSGTETIRLVMAGAGHDRGDRPATARRIADAWGFDVQAPDGPPLVVPGGSLFVPAVPVGAGLGGWWRFAPGAKPEPLGPRSPAPPWQTALRGVPADTDSGCAVEQIPAGLLVRPADAAATRPGDLYHSVPVDPRRLVVVVGVPHGEDVAAEEVADVLGALPEPVRSAVRLAPGGRHDLLPLAQSVSDRLDAEVELMTGLPLSVAGGQAGTYTIRSVLVGPDGKPQWLPFVDAAVCRPARGAERPPPPRLLGRSLPLTGFAQPEQGVAVLSDQWQATATRAGLWVGPRGGPRPSRMARVSAAGPLVEVGVQDERPDSSLWSVLSDLLASLVPDLRERVIVQVHGVPRDGGRELRRLAAQHGLRTIRFTPPPAPAPEEGDGAPRREDGPGEPGRPRATAESVRTEGPGAEKEPGRVVRPGSGGEPVPAAGTALAGVPGETARRVRAQSSGQGEVLARSPGLGAAEERKRGDTEVRGSASGTGLTGAPRSPARSGRPESPARADDRGSSSAFGTDLSTPRRATARTGSVPGGTAPDTEPGSPGPGHVRDPAAGPESGPGTAVDPVPSRRAAEVAGAPEEPDDRPAGPTASVSAPDLDLEGEEAARTSLPPVPFAPGHRSTEDERSAFRVLADAEWDRHGAAVARSLARMPALRGREQEAARADLIALRLYLHSAEGPWSHRALTRALRSDEEGPLPYAACLTSALNRLPSYRGVVLRGTGAGPGHGVRVPRPGTLLRDPAPVSASPLDPIRPAMTTGGSYVIWSVTARRIRQLLDAGDGPEEVVFAPGAVFRVLDVRGGDSSAQIFLRELTGPHLPPRPDPDGDGVALARLDEAVRGRSAPAGGGQWPERCTGPFGAGPETPPNHRHE